MTDKMASPSDALDEELVVKMEPEDPEEFPGTDMQASVNMKQSCATAQQGTAEADQVSEDVNAADEEKGPKKSKRLPMSEADKFQLITLVRMEPCIWDFNDPSYNDRRNAERSYVRIAAALGKDEEEVKKKFRMLRNQYGRILRGQSSKQPWKFFDALSFLQPYVTKRQSYTRDDLDMDEQTTQQEETAETLQHPEEGTASIPGEKKAPVVICLYFDLDTEMCARWRRVGHSEGLRTDTDIANFLVNLYEEKERESCTQPDLHCPRCHFLVERNTSPTGKRESSAGSTWEQGKGDAPTMTSSWPGSGKIGQEGGITLIQAAVKQEGGYGKVKQVSGTLQFNNQQLKKISPAIQIGKIDSQHSLNQDPARKKLNLPRQIIALDGTSGGEGLGKPVVLKTFVMIPSSSDVSQVKVGSGIVQSGRGPVAFRQRGSKLKSKMPRINRCRICLATFMLKADLSKHRQIHIGEKRFFCDICNRAFKTRSNLQTHVNRHTGVKSCVCELCGKAFVNMSDLRQHEITHNPEKKKEYVCKTCGRVFTSPRYYEVHLRKHTGEKPFQCDICGVSFSSKRYLKNHLIVHSQDTPYACEWCEQRFRRGSELRDHIQTHIKGTDRPYDCNICGRTFKGYTHFARHKKLHTDIKKFECDVCGKKFFQRGNLKLHMRVHSRAEPCLCRVCGKAFRWESCRNKHMESCKGRMSR